MELYQEPKQLHKLVRRYVCHIWRMFNSFFPERRKSNSVRGAHKLVPVRFEEQGFSCFVYSGQWYVYPCCYFGCKWAAYWFSRVGSFLLRHLHQFIYISHAAFLYVDDGVCLVACCGLLFMCALGVPFSWEKMSFGQTFQWLGWCFDLTKPCAFVPQSKREKLLPLLDLLCNPAALPERRVVVQVVNIIQCLDEKMVVGQLVRSAMFASVGVFIQSTTAW